MAETFFKVPGYYEGIRARRIKQSGRLWLVRVVNDPDKREGGTWHRGGHMMRGFSEVRIATGGAGPPPQKEGPRRRARAKSQGSPTTRALLVDTPALAPMQVRRELPSSLKSNPVSRLLSERFSRGTPA
jgi:hypothetical protein